MGLEILTPRQRALLDLVRDAPAITDHFVLSGGTALSAFHYNHRDSEDLDFFSTEEFPLDAIVTWLRGVRDAIGYDSLDIETSFNRNLVFLTYADGSALKTEFTYFPFTALEDGPRYGALRVESRRDLAVNKLFTISQRPRARDFIDLYLLMTREGYVLDALLRDVRAKFDAHVDPLQLGTQCLKARDIADLPRMRLTLAEDTWRTYFVNLAKGFGDDILAA